MGQKAQSVTTTIVIIMPTITSYEADISRW